MLQNILNLKGTQELSKPEQQSIKGGASCSTICTQPNNYPGYQLANCCAQGYCTDPSVCP